MQFKKSHFGQAFLAGMLLVFLSSSVVSNAEKKVQKKSQKNVATDKPSVKVPVTASVSTTTIQKITLTTLPTTAKLPITAKTPSTSSQQIVAVAKKSGATPRVSTIPPEVVAKLQQQDKGQIVDIVKAAYAHSPSYLAKGKGGDEKDSVVCMTGMVRGWLVNGLLAIPSNITPKKASKRPVKKVVTRYTKKSREKPKALYIWAKLTNGAIVKRHFTVHGHSKIWNGSDIQLMHDSPLVSGFKKKNKKATKITNKKS